MKKKIYIVGIIIFLLDQLLKVIVISNISYQKIIDVIPNFFYLTYVKNTGGAWSIFDKVPYVLIIIGFLFLIWFIYYLHKKHTFTPLENIYLGLLLGGVVGNFIDRIIQGGVIDYIGMILFGYYFPVFNLADICIVCGGILIIIDCFRSDINGIRSNER